MFKVDRKANFGPLDRRLRRTRCANCSRQHLKCEGGVPCKRCQKDNEACSLAELAPAGRRGVFVNQFVINAVEMSSSCQPTLTPRPNPIFACPDRKTEVIRMVFDFFRSHQFSLHGVVSYGNHLLGLIHSSAPLYWACIALWASMKQCHGFRSDRDEYFANFGLAAYLRAIRLLLERLKCKDVHEQEDLVWSSFVLSLVEMRCDNTASDWTRHHTFGTCRLLASWDRESLRSNERRQFIFHSSRLIEACRGILYDCPAFGTDDQWLRIRDVSSAYGSEYGHTFDDVIEFLVRCSYFGGRMRDYIQRKASTGATYIELESLSQTGWELQQEILAWKLSAKDPNSFNQVAMLYQQGMLIYLSGQYDYRPELGTLPANVPRRTGTEIQTHVLRILDLTPHLLNKSNFAEVMYLFPLRVAGARAVDFVTRSKVIGLARRIAERGFRVTERVLSDLQLLWRFRDSGLAPLPITEI